MCIKIEGYPYSHYTGEDSPSTVKDLRGHPLEPLPSNKKVGPSSTIYPGRGVRDKCDLVGGIRRGRGIELRRVETSSLMEVYWVISIRDPQLVSYTHAPTPVS